MVRLTSFLSIVFALVLTGLAPALAERRLALVVGNNTYANLPADKQLSNAISDARAMRGALQGLGFEVLYGENLDRRTLIDRLFDVTARLGKDDIAFFFFAGHGVSFSGANYLLPADIPPPRASGRAEEGRLAEQAVAETTVIERLTGSGARVSVVVLDACRNNPLQGSNRRSVGNTRGLSQGQPARGVFSIYSAGFGQEALDRLGRDDRHPNSVFTRVFIEKLKTPGLDLKAVATQTRSVVIEMTQKIGHDQFPAYYDQMIGGDVYLAGLPATLPGAATTPTDEAARVWAVTKDTTSVAMLEEFIRQFGSTPYGSMARARLDELKKSQVAVVAPPVQAVTPPSAVQPAVGVFPTSRSTTPLMAVEERALKPKDSFKECDVCPEMIVVPAGSFVMGSAAGENGRSTHEGPQHDVTFARQFAVGKFSVTFDEWDACVRDGGCKGHRPGDEGWGRGKRPAINVSWSDAKTYIDWLSRKTGKSYRLLSEAEREYVTRAGTTTPFWWGSSISKEQANYDYDPKNTVPVDSYQPNPWGLYQVHGNVYEWVEDCYYDSYNGAPSDGSAWASTRGHYCKTRVARGGSFFHSSESARSASRYTTQRGEWFRVFQIGFRVARTLDAAAVGTESSSAQHAAVALPVVPAPSAPSSATPAVGVFPSAPGATPLSPERERALKPKDTFKECGQCPEMVVVPAGSFKMGSPPSEMDRTGTDGPQHQVTFERLFALGRFEVTFDEWDACVTDGGCGGYEPPDRGWGRGRRPVINVSWHDAKSYVEWLSRKTGKTYRLLSEAEWEYAARAGTTTRFSCGDDKWCLDRISWYFSNAVGRTQLVGQKPANDFGLSDMHGNVWEWTEDCWNDSYSGAPMDGSAWTGGDCSRRVLRGGSWNTFSVHLRSADRFRFTTDYRFNDHGFRVARTLVTP